MYHGVGLGTSGVLTGVAIATQLPKSRGFHFMIIVAAVSLTLGLIVFSTSTAISYRKRSKNR